MFGANAYANFDDFIDYPGKAPRRLPDAELLGLGPLYRLYRCRSGWIFLSAESAEAQRQLRQGLAALGYRDVEWSALERVLIERDASEWEQTLASRGVSCAIADPDVSLPAWLWWGIGIAGVMLALTVLAFRTNIPRRIAEKITANSNEFDVGTSNQLALAGTVPGYVLTNNESIPANFVSTVTASTFNGSGAGLSGILGTARADQAATATAMPARIMKSSE